MRNDELLTIVLFQLSLGPEPDSAPGFPKLGVDKKDSDPQHCY